MKKRFLFLCGVVLLALVAIGGTMAYFTDGERKVNTFTVGDLDITLSESEWDDTSDGKLMVPGYETLKNPTVYSVEGDAYMRLSIEFVSADNNEMTKERAEKIMQTIFFGDTNGINDELFTKDISRSSDSKYYFNYNEKFSEGTSAVLFDSIKIPKQWNQNDISILGEYKIVVKAEAIQFENFESSEQAFSALDGEIAANTACENYKTSGNT